MSLPTAVASGVEAAPQDVIVPVSPLRVAIGAGLLAALYLVVVYFVHPVPGRFVRLVGGRGDDVARTGGVRIVWQPPPGYDLAKIGDSLEHHGTLVTREGDHAVIELGDVTAEDAQEVVDGLTQAPLQFHEVVEAKEMESLIRLLDLHMKDQWPLDAEVDQWRPEDGGPPHTDYYLRGRTRADIEQAFAKAREQGWAPPAGTHVAYEHITGPKEAWRSYIVKDEVGFDGDDVENAVGSYDPNTNRPVVMVEMTRVGAARFGDLTGRIVGGKLAIMTGDLVKSAPVINGKIGGGRAQITMGAGDTQQMERERDVLVKVLRAGVLPAGGTVLKQELVPPIDGPVKIWLGRLALALGGGGLVGLLAWILVRLTRPVRRRAPARASGPWPASRLFVTLLAPAAVVALSYLPVPGIDGEAFYDVMHKPVRDFMNLGSIGLTPVVTAYLIANLVRAIRRRPEVSGHVVALSAILLTSLQAWMISRYLQSFPLEELIPQTSTAMLTIIVAFGAATAFLAGVAWIVRAHGLGNGYGALIAGGWLVIVVRGLLATPDAVTIAQILAIAIPVMVVLRWRVYGAGEPALRVPSSGIVPISQAGGLAMVLAVLAYANLDLSKVFDILELVRSHLWASLGLAAALVVAWSAAFAWPPAAHVSWASWRRATLLSFAVVGGVGAVMISGTRIVEPIVICVTAAVLLDAYDDLRARRVMLEHVWSVQSSHLAEQIERRLADAGIPSHLSGSHLRTILGGFGGFAPVNVLVPTEHAPAASTLLSSD